PNDKQIAKALVKHQLRRDARVAAPEDHRVGPLTLAQADENLLGDRAVQGLPLDEPLVAFAQQVKCFLRSLGWRWHGHPHFNSQWVMTSCRPVLNAALLKRYL